MQQHPTHVGVTSYEDHHNMSEGNHNHPKNANIKCQSNRS